MPKPRGRNHTSLTETAAIVVKALQGVPGIKMIAPGEIASPRRNRTGKRWITAVFTKAGMELIISGQGTQKIAVHTSADACMIFQQLQQDKRLQSFQFKTRLRVPGQ